MKKDKLIISGMTVASFLVTGFAANAELFKATDSGDGIKVAEADTKTSDGKCGEGMCGEGKCGSDMKEKDGKCGDKKTMKEKDGKCGEGICSEKKTEVKPGAATTTPAATPSAPTTPIEGNGKATGY